MCYSLFHVYLGESVPTHLKMIVGDMITLFRFFIRFKFTVPPMLAVKKEITEYYLMDYFQEYFITGEKR
jgi:hypothetical protein